MNRHTAVKATDINNGCGGQSTGYTEGDTEVEVSVMRSCVFLSVTTDDGGVIAHVELSHEDWEKLIATPGRPA